MTVPCGKCGYCLQTKRDAWTIRINKELQNSASAYFITLTYDDLLLGDTSAQLNVRHCQLFFKRLRKADAKNKQQIMTGKTKGLRYFLSSEYGSQNGRPHYHVILFNASEQTVVDLEKIWGHGFIKRGTVNSASIHYVTGYIINDWPDDDPRQKPFALMSRNGGLGKEYIINNREYYNKNELQYVTVNGYKKPLPRLYKDAVFTQKQKKMMYEKKIKQMDILEAREISRIAEQHRITIHEAGNLYEKRKHLKNIKILMNIK